MEEAKRLNTTRAIISIRKAAREADGAIYAIGNAPTALLELIRLVKEGQAKPGLIIGVPVGFVSAAESKEELLKLDVPFITNIGRKGGSLLQWHPLMRCRCLQSAKDKRHGCEGVQAAASWIYDGRLRDRCGAGGA